MAKDKEKKKIPFNTFRKGLAGALIGATILAGGVALTGCSGAGEKGDPGKDGIDGTNGSVWYHGADDPTANIGVVGDYYFETDNGNVWFRGTNGWAVISNITGPQGPEGPEGPQGPEGKPGEDGEDGSSGGSGSSTEANVLYGKSILAIGDSYVAGHTSPVADTWISQLAARNNMTKYVYAENGISVSHPTTVAKNGLVDKMSTIISQVEDVDYIVFLAGHNDANASLNGGAAVPIGTDDDATSATYKGSLNIIIETLLNNYPTAEILFLTPFERYGTEEAYVTAMEEVCAKWSIPCFDNYHDSGICWQNDAQKEAYESANLHFNKAGHERISYIYETILKNHLVIGGGVGGGSNNGNTSGGGSTTNPDSGNEDDGGSTTPTPDGGGEAVSGFTFAHAAGNTKRACATITLKAGQTVNFAKAETWSTYKYAIGPGNKGISTTWIGGGWQDNAAVTVSEAGVYTIMVARQDDAELATTELKAFETFFSFTEATPTPDGGEGGEDVGGGEPTDPTPGEGEDGGEGTPEEIVLTFAFISHSDGNQVRAGATVELTAGTTIDFANVADGATYKYAIGLGNNGAGTSWIGGGYQTAGTPCTIVTSGLHTIMIARVDNAAMTEEELALFAKMFVIVVA